MTYWLSKAVVLAIHEEQLERHGGASGVRDEGLLESALARPQNAAAYSEPDMAELAALHALGIARNHPFIDGNKRAAWMAMVTFLDLNGYAFSPPEVEAVLTMLAMAAGEVEDAVFVAWVRHHAARG